MKKLGKLSISSEKIMKNEELINLQGGAGYDNCCQCYTANMYWFPIMIGPTSPQECIELCEEAYHLDPYASGYWHC